MPSVTCNLSGSFFSEKVCFSEYQADFLRLFGDNKLDIDFISLDDLETWSFPAVLGLAGGAIHNQFHAISYLQSQRKLFQ